MKRGKNGEWAGFRRVPVATAGSFIRDASLNDEMRRYDLFFDNKPYVYLCLFHLFTFCFLQYTFIPRYLAGSQFAVTPMRAVAVRIKCCSDPLGDSSIKIIRQLEHVFESYRMTFNGLTFCKLFTDFRFSRGVLEPNPAKSER